MCDVANILFGAAFTVALSVALGALLVARLRLSLYRWEAALIQFVAGAGCLSFFTAILCILHIARKGVFQWTGAAVIALALWQARRAPRRKSLPAVPLNWIATCFLICGPFWWPSPPAATPPRRWSTLRISALCPCSWSAGHAASPCPRRDSSPPS